MNQKLGAETFEANISTSTVTGNVSVTENTSLRRISITKPSVTPKISSPFLINSTALTLGHLSRKSFLNRDTTTLAKLAGLTKTGGDGEAIINTKRKGNYVFVATEKKNVRRKRTIRSFQYKIKYFFLLFFFYRNRKENQNVNWILMVHHLQNF